MEPSAAGGFRVCRVYKGLGFRGLGLRAKFRVQGLGFRVQQVWFRVEGLGFRGKHPSKPCSSPKSFLEVKGWNINFWLPLVVLPYKTVLKYTPNLRTLF